jgi:hypothetical protein
VLLSLGYRRISGQDPKVVAPILQSHDGIVVPLTTIEEAKASGISLDAVSADGESTANESRILGTLPGGQLVFSRIVLLDSGSAEQVLPVVDGLPERQTVLPFNTMTDPKLPFFWMEPASLSLFRTKGPLFVDQLRHEGMVGFPINSLSIAAGKYAKGVMARVGGSANGTIPDSVLTDEAGLREHIVPTACLPADRQVKSLSVYVLGDGGGFMDAGYGGLPLSESGLACQSVAKVIGERMARLNVAEDILPEQWWKYPDEAIGTIDAWKRATAPGGPDGGGRWLTADELCKSLSIPKPPYELLVSQFEHLSCPAPDFATEMPTIFKPVSFDEFVRRPDLDRFLRKVLGPGYTFAVRCLTNPEGVRTVVAAAMAT